MSDSVNSSDINKGEGYHTYKRCPYCYTHLKLSADHCIECRKKVGMVDKLGLAKKPFPYKAYIAAGLWILVFVIYFWKLIIMKIIAAMNSGG